MSRFDLKRFLASRKAVVEKALDAVLPQEDVRPAVLHEAVRYAVFSGGGGKSLRPILAMMVAHALGKPERLALSAGVAIELFHNYTLVHDDLPCMDDDAFRRGVPAVHKKFGYHVAVLAGDFLQQCAFAALADSRLPPEVIRDQLRILGASEVVAGQIEDLACANSADLEQMCFIHERKTSDLFIRAAVMGALSAGVPLRSKVMDAIGDYALYLGLAFQIVDDLLDGARKDELSVLNLMDASSARRLAQNYTDKALQSLYRFAVRPERLAALAEGLLDRLA